MMCALGPMTPSTARSAATVRAVPVGSPRSASLVTSVLDLAIWIGLDSRRPRPAHSTGSPRRTGSPWSNPNQGRRFKPSFIESSWVALMAVASFVRKNSSELDWNAFIISVRSIPNSNTGISKGTDSRG
jgi:hypothetical protein